MSLKNTPAQRMHLAQELLDSGILCECPIIEVVSEDSYSGKLETIPVVHHEHFCKGAKRMLKLLKMKWTEESSRDSEEK